MEDKNLMMTEADILGIQLRAKEIVESLLFPVQRRRLPRMFSALETMDELLKRDEQREKDGFPRKIKTRRILVGNKVISIPYVEEEQLIHGEFEPKKLKKFAQFDDEEEGEDLGENVGHGEGEVGDVIGEIPIGGAGVGGGPEPGTEPGPHQEEIYETGKRLIEKYHLPNLKEKGKKVPVDEPAYDLTDRFRGSGQILDKKETLKRIIKTNILLGRLGKDKPDTSKLIVGPRDKVYRVLSREKQYKSQAVVFFLRDYSGSMWGEPTRVIVEQHLMLYGWLMVQYEKLVIPRFIVHDTEAQEVPVEKYFRLAAGGGTLIPSGYKKIIEIIESEGLERDYNIFVFQGTDGEDFDDGKLAIPLIQKILTYVNRMGVCVLKHSFWREEDEEDEEDRETQFEQYVKRGNFLTQRELFRMHTMSYLDVTEQTQAEAIGALVAQD